jgi:peptidoglycan-associated lipoprotein
MTRFRALAILLVLVAAIGACTKKSGATTPASAPAPNPFPGATTKTPPAPVRTEVPPPPPEIRVDTPAGVMSDPLSSAAIDTINKDSPLKPVFFRYDSDALDDLARNTMSGNADVLRKYATWVITVEGHCDERGTAEYNLSLGDRRALAVKNYMVSLGIGADRIRTVSYGSEFPFAPGHDEDAWSLNRRAHFMLTAKQ